MFAPKLRPARTTRRRTLTARPELQCLEGRVVLSTVAIRPAAPPHAMIHALSKPVGGTVRTLSSSITVGAQQATGLENEADIKSKLEGFLKGVIDSGNFVVKITGRSATLTALQVDYGQHVATGTYKLDVKIKYLSLFTQTKTFSGKFSLDTQTGKFSGDVQVATLPVVGKISIPTDRFQKTVNDATKQAAQAIEQYLGSVISDAFLKVKSQVEAASPGRVFVASKGFSDAMKPSLLLKSGITATTPLSSATVGRLARDNRTLFQTELNSISSWARSKGVSVSSATLYSGLSKGQTTFGKLSLTTEPVAYSYRAFSATTVAANQFVLVARL